MALDLNRLRVVVIREASSWKSVPLKQQFVERRCLSRTFILNVMRKETQPTYFYKSHIKCQKPKFSLWAAIWPSLLKMLKYWWFFSYNFRNIKQEMNRSNIDILNICKSRWASNRDFISDTTQVNTCKHKEKWKWFRLTIR